MGSDRELGRSSTDERIARWVRPEIRAQAAYQVQNADGLIKLDAMENPYSWPGELLPEWLEALATVNLNRYPDPVATGVKARLREFLGLPHDAPLVLGNGSDELIQLLIVALGGPGRSVLAPEPTFVMYRMLAEMNGLEFHGVPLKEPDFALDIERMLDAITTRQPAIVFLASPNNPTANLVERSALEAVLEASPGIVVVDEAYFPFARETCLPLLERYPHLFVMQTLSKLGLAGLRIGLLAGRTEWLAELDKIRLPYNINALSQRSAEMLLSRADVLHEQAARICADRDELRRRLAQIPSVAVWPSCTNFLLFKVQGHAPALHAALRRKGVLIKLLHGTHPLLENCLRVTIGTTAETDRFVEVLRTELEARS